MARKRVGGRTFETLEDRRLMSAAVAGDVWQIRGEDAGRSKADAIVVEPTPGNAAVLRAVINGAVAGTADASVVTRIEVDGGNGDDRITVQLPIGSAITTRLLGGKGADYITGSANADAILGGPGNDRLLGGADDDTLEGEAGNDRLLGGDGNDTLRGGAGRDALAGGSGNDILAGDKGADRLKGGANDDNLSGGAGDDRLYGGDGVDTMDGGKGSDRVYRQPGVDVVGSAIATRRDKLDDEPAAPTSRESDDASLRRWVVDAAVEQWKWALGQSKQDYVYYADAGGAVNVRRTADFAGSIPTPTPTTTPTPTSAPAPSAPAPSVGAEAGGTGATGGGDSSGTNTQEAGVDEADLVETDGKYIYSIQGQELVITEAFPASALRVVSRTKIDGSPQGIYLHDGRVTVVSGTYYYYLLPFPIEPGIAVDDAVRGGVSSRLIAPPVPQDPPTVTVTVLDVADVAAPRVVEKTKIDGQYDSSRLIGDRLYLAIRNDTWVPAPLPIPIVDDGTTPPADDGDGDGTAPGDTTTPGKSVPGSSGIDLTPIISRPAATTAYESEAAYRARLEALPLTDLLPSYTAKGEDGTESTGSLVAAPGAYVREGDAPIGQNLTTVALLNVADDKAGPIDTQTVAGFGGTVYASTDAFYIAGTDYTESAGQVTRLFKFAIGPDAVSMVATGEVPGTVAGQFSMDEEGDYFRIATNRFDNGGQHSGVYVLEQVGDDLDLVGSVTNLARGEQLQSARFIGDRAYLVTFRQVDPLFTIDLANPRSPKVAGELKIPGFSTYLHPVGEDYLLGIGRDADETTGRDKGLQVSLFNVSNASKPTLVARQKLSDEFGASSEAEYDHHAFSYFSEQRILAIPVNRYDIGDGFEQTLAVLRVDAAGGKFDPLGSTEPPGGAHRTLRIDDALYAVGDTHIQATKLEEPGTVLGTVKVGE